MRRLATLAVILAGGLATSTGAALAAPTTPPVGTPSDHAACVAAFTDYLAHFNPDTGTTNHGVGTTMSDYATSAPRTIAEFNVSVNQQHGTIDSCLTTEP